MKAKSFIIFDNIVEPLEQAIVTSTLFQETLLPFRYQEVPPYLNKVKKKKEDYDALHWS